MDPQFLVNLGFGLAGLLGGFVLKATWSEIKGLQLALAELQKSIADTYIRRDDFRNLIDDMKATLVRIEIKLDTKQDRV
jgi:hypothetical protein